MKELAILLNNLTFLESFVLTKEGNLHFICDTSVISGIMKSDRIQTFNEITKLTKNFSNQECLHYRSKSLQNYLAVTGKGLITVLGPFLSRLPDNTMISEILINCQIPSSSRLLVQDYYRQLSILENRRIVAIADAITVLNRSSVSSCSLIYKTAQDIGEEQNDFLRIVQIEEELPDISIISERYKIETALMQAVAQGDKQKARDVFKSSGEIINLPDRVKKDPLRSIRDITITINTILRVAARQGGLHPRYLHSISEKYAILLEKKISIKDIIELRIRMIDEYCDAVKYRGMVNYSRLVSKGIQYILYHLDEEISLDIIAKELEVNPSYLSRLFRQETGLTISRFINEKRVNEAGYLLIHTNAPISDISLQVGYPDSGYFSRVFHQIKGMKPTEWRNSEKSF